MRDASASAASRPPCTLSLATCDTILPPCAAMSAVNTGNAGRSAPASAGTMAFESQGAARIADTLLRHEVLDLRRLLRRVHFARDDDEIEALRRAASSRRPASSALKNACVLVSSVTPTTLRRRAPPVSDAGSPPHRARPPRPPTRSHQHGAMPKANCPAQANLMLHCSWLTLEHYLFPRANREAVKK